MVGGVLVTATVLPLAGPELMRAFVDGAIAHRPTGHLLVLAGAYLGLATASQAVAVVSTYQASGVAWRTSNRLRELVAAHALRLDMAFHARHSPGEMIERVDGDLLGLSEFLSGFVAQAVGGALLLVGAIAVVLWTSALAGAALTGLVVVGAVLTLRAQRRVVPIAAQVRQATAEMFGGIEEALVAADELRANGAGPHLVNRFHRDAARVYRFDLQWQIRGGAVLAGTNLLFGLGTAFIVGVGVILLRRGAVTVGTVVLLLQYSMLVRSPVEAIVGQAKQLHEAGAAASRVGSLLADRPAISEPARPRRLTAGPLGLRYEGISFAYGHDPAVIHDLDLEIPSGGSLGLVGRTGSGKTTLARLALRLYDPTNGAVRLGGVDLREVAGFELRRRVRMVTQDVHLFSASVRDNLTLFDDSVPDADAAAALRAVGLGPWLEALPAGLSSELGQAGAGLSAGEAQLLSFARVLVADPDLVILDEPSSRLDPATEALVERAGAELLAGRTTLVIAHRLATLVDVDHIAVLEAGRLVEYGPRAELASDPTSRFSRLLVASGVPA